MEKSGGFTRRRALRRIDAPHILTMSFRGASGFIGLTQNRGLPRAARRATRAWPPVIARANERFSRPFVAV
jgi:hypothetical protein